MASDKLGSQFDIHSGGIDLAFPHHDNELAQSEAYWNEDHSDHQHQWVNYFIHMGHLSIAGAKMSKSLKNFTTIRDALSHGIWTSRGLRIILLLSAWQDGIEITDSVVKEGSAWENTVNNFFIQAKERVGDSQSQGVESLSLSKHQALTLKDLHGNVPLNGSESVPSTQGNGLSAFPLNEALQRAKLLCYLALCDSFNSRVGMLIISEIIACYNAAEATPSDQITTDIATWITSMINILGLNGNADPCNPTIGWSGIDIPEFARPALTAISSLRDQIRTKARSANGITNSDLDDAVATSRQQFSISDPPQPFTDLLQTTWTTLEALPSNDPLSIPILKLCDEIRDRDLWDRGIYLEDRYEGDKPALIRLVTKEQQAARQEKEEKEAQKAKVKAEVAAKADKGKLSHLEMYKTPEWSEWDAEGLPTKDEKGEDITKSRAKVLKKGWEKQKKLHEAWLKTNSKA